MKKILEVSTDIGGIAVAEDDLQSITDAELKGLRMSRAELHRLFALGMELMKSRKPGERVRPCADQRLDGEWEVRIVHYSQFSDPLMHEPPAGKGVKQEEQS
jgi:hypothetical protein